ncbi:MAG: hypothetical protein QNK37_22620 [Acidobacteriota bacterium]|nr:hypothetical protein [Acidobacteriota bacterium]
MKKLCGLVILLSLLIPAGLADFLVLKNGKRFEVPEGYQVKGQYVVFKTSKGQLTQLPLKLVDLAKSEELTKQMEARRRKDEEAKAAAEKAAAKRRFSQRKTTMSDITDYVQKNRDPKKPAPERLSIGDDQVESFAETNPRQTNTTASSGSSSGSSSAADYASEADRLAGEYQRLVKEIEDLENRIRAAQQHRNNMENIAAYGDEFYGSEDVHDPNTPIEEDEGGNASFDEARKAEKQITDLQNQKKKKEKQLKELEKEARQKDIRDYKRRKPKKKSGEEESDEDTSDRKYGKKSRND